jgi:NADH:ubiquinone oxidoreductase subunit 2 (subunit N)
MATLRATIPIQMGICMTCTSGLDQDAAVAFAAVASSIVVATLGAVAGLRAICAFQENRNDTALNGTENKRPWLTLGWAVALFSLSGFPPTFGFTVRRGMLSTLMSDQHVSLMVLVSFASVGLISVYFSMLRQVFLVAPFESISTQDPELPGGQSFQVKGTSSIPRFPMKRSFVVVWGCALLSLFLFDLSDLLEILRRVAQDVTFW